MYNLKRLENLEKCQKIKMHVKRKKRQKNQNAKKKMNPSFSLRHLVLEASAVVVSIAGEFL